MFRLCAAGLLLLLTSSLGSAQDSPGPPVLSSVGLSPGANVLLTPLLRGLHSPDLYLRQVRSLFDGLDLDGDGTVTPDDERLREQKMIASERANAAAQIMRYDLNGDGYADASELLLSKREVASALFGTSGILDFSVIGVRRDDPDAVTKLVERADKDKDGRISFVEAGDLSAARTAARSLNNLGNPSSALYTLRSDGQKVVPWPFVEATARTLYGLVDANSDGRVTSEELAEFRLHPRF